jgi:dipeptidyl-peptidase-4
MYKRFLLSLLLAVFLVYANAQPPQGIRWSAKGDSYFEKSEAGLVKVHLPDMTKTTIAASSALIPAGQNTPLFIRNFFLSPDESKVLIYTNAKRVWRYETRGDYWLLDLKTNKLSQAGKGLPPSSMLYAKFSPDGTKLAYVSDHNIFLEDMASGAIKQLTKDGTVKIINGTFDWAYEEEFSCRDGFRWSPDGKNIAYWQIDASTMKNFYLINNTDSIYSFIKPVEYPKVGENPSSCRLGVLDIATGETKWMSAPGNAVQHYIPRMEWSVDGSSLILEQLTRKQNESRIYLADAKSGSAKMIHEEKDKAWIDTKSRWHLGPEGWEWIDNGKSFLWVSEKDGWRHIYSLTMDGQERLLTKGNYDAMDILGIDEKNGYIYFDASPKNATQKYLYRVKLDGSKDAEKVSPENQSGTHNYQLSPNGQYAHHSFSNVNTPTIQEWVKLPAYKVIAKQPAETATINSGIEFFQVTTSEGITMDGWMIKPKNFDPSKKYPVVFFVYGEAAGQTVLDQYGIESLDFIGDTLTKEQYVQISLDNRGTPAPKGAEFRKSIYRNLGVIGIRDQALGAKKISQWPFIDSTRMTVWGHSGGGSTTLGLMFQYPGLFQTGISMSPVTNLLTYDNIYEERYMGLPQENMEDYVKGSAITYAKNLKGHLLLIHGTGDDNVHYQNTEMLVNELIKDNKVFEMMAYPNRSHGLYEGIGSYRHITTIFLDFLKRNCAPGGR